MQIDRRTVLMAGVLACAGAGSSPAQEAPAADVFPLAGDPVLETLVAEALERNPELRGAREEVAAARARVAQAGALPDPVIGAGYQYGGAGGLGADVDTFLALSVGQRLPFWGKRRLAQELEAKEAVRLQEPLARVRLDVVQRVRAAYTGLLLARENLALLAEQEQATLGIEAVTRSRYGVGLAEQADVLRAQAERARLARMRIHEQGGEQVAAAELNMLLARPAGTLVPQGARLAELGARKLEAPALPALLAQAERASPERADARLAVERSRLAVDLARRSRKPDFELQTTYMHRGSLPAMWAVNMGVLAPVYAGRKQGQAVVESEARLRAAEARAEAVHLSVRAGIERSLAELSAALLEADAYASGVLALDRLAAESALANYEAGKIPFVAVLEAHNALYRDRWTHAELLAHVLWHSARLDALLPAEPEPRP